LQHPREVDRAKGTARLLHLSLPNSRIVVGEVLTEFELQAVLSEPLPGCSAASACKQAVLLYPDTPYGSVLGLLTPVVAPSQITRDPSRLRLIVLDGTWRESRKMLWLNPRLQSLPRMSLQETQSSRYSIRKAQRPGQLSTLEASCAALSQLEEDAEKFQPLLNALDGFVAQQSGYMKRTDQ
jgi:DTW domain-containing protein YfiP